MPNSTDLTTPNSFFSSFLSLKREQSHQLASNQWRALLESLPPTLWSMTKQHLDCITHSLNSVNTMNVFYRMPTLCADTSLRERHIIVTLVRRAGDRRIAAAWTIFCSSLSLSLCTTAFFSLSLRQKCEYLATLFRALWGPEVKLVLSSSLVFHGGGQTLQLQHRTASIWFERSLKQNNNKKNVSFISQTKLAQIVDSTEGENERVK